MSPASARARRIERLEKPLASSHAGLWLDRFLDRQKWAPGEPEEKAKAQGEEARARLLDGVQHIKTPEGYAEAFGAWEAGLEAQADRVVRARATTVGRLLVGAGQKNPAEFGITLHRTWGLPYIPGSSLKGIAAWGAHHGLGPAFARRPNSAEARPGAPNAFDALFGDVEEQGAVIFHDAWICPSSAPGLHRDVLTVHHPDYYQGNKEPSDLDSPTPVGFISASGEFLVALELHPALDPADGGHWLEAAWRALEYGLQHHGVGAKTNVGYGRVELPAWERTPAGRRIEEARQRAEQEREAARQRAEQERLARERQALPVAQRLQEIRKSEGVEAIFAWLKGERDELPGLVGSREEVQGAARCLRDLGRGGGLAQACREAWRPWVQEVLAPPAEPARPAAVPKEPKPRKSLSDEELARILNKCKSDPNEAVTAILKLNPDEETIQRAVPLLESKGAKPGHLKRLREGR